MIVADVLTKNTAHAQTWVTLLKEIQHIIDAQVDNILNNIR